MVIKKKNKTVTICIQNSPKYIFPVFFFNFTVCNPGQNIWNTIEKSSNIEQKKERLISTFVYFLTTIGGV